MKRPTNPFVLGKYISDYYFCDRVKETEMLRKHIVNGRNVTMIAHRRIGKTGLIEHFFNQEYIKKTYYTVFIDIYATKNLTEFAYLLSNAVYESVKGNLLTQVQNFFKSISTLRVGLRIDSLTGEPTLDLQMGQIKSPEATLKEIFAYLDGMGRPVIIAIDEFQKIGDYAEKDTEAMLRTMIQKCRNIQFIFSGSQKHMLSNMFTSPSKPFYQSTMLMYLEPIDRKEYVEFAQRLFVDYGKSVEAEVVEQVYDICRGTTWYIQAYMNELFADTLPGESCSAEQLPVALSNIIAANAPAYLDTLSRISDKQKRVLLAIAKAKEVTEPTSQQFIEIYGLGSSSSVQSALRPLIDQEIVMKDGDTYRISDVFFSIWLSTY